MKGSVRESGRWASSPLRRTLELRSLPGASSRGVAGPAFCARAPLVARRHEPSAGVRRVHRRPFFATQAPVTFTYWPSGWRKTMTDSTGVTSYGYDLRDRLLSKSTPEGALTYTYDL